MANEPTPGQTASEGITEKPAPLAPVAATSENITATLPSPGATTKPGAPAAATGPAPLPVWLLKADLAILALLLVLTFLLGSFTATNSDLWTHLAIGQRISDGDFTFGVDPFSWLSEATPDKPAPFWVHQSWLYSWLFFQLHELVGAAGLVLIKATLFTVAIGLLSRIGWNETNRWFTLIALAMAALAVSPRLLLQPMVISFLFLSLTLFVLVRVGFFARARPDGKRPCPRSLWALPPLFALWANLDAWFILGPIVVGLCWAAVGLMRWFPHAKVVPGKTLGLVFGVSVLACLVNPYHVRVFQLPPELAYLVVSLTDAVHLRLPNEVVGAGRTLSEMRKGDGDFSWTIATASWKYLSDARYGWNIAGLAVVPLLLLGLLAFTLTARIKPQPGAPTFHVGRFVLWLAFGVMALALYRMIPFFVLIAAPLTAMTLGEFLHWQQTVSAVAAEKRDRGLKLARFVSIPFVLLLIGLAWPGWLQGSNDFTSQRRVAWDMRADPSLKRTAQILQALKKKGEGQNVFNSKSLDLAHHMTWFAPDVKFGIDSRFALYAESVPQYGKVGKALAAQNPAEWQDYFVKHKVDQVVVVSFIKRDNSFPLHWWLEVDQWRQREGDNRAVIFSWAGRDQRWPADDDAAWNREAFGPVPADRRPPAAGVMTPQTPTPLALYLDGVKPTPIGVPEFLLLKKRYGFYDLVRSQAGRHTGMIWMLGSLTGVQALPEGGMTMAPAFAGMFEPWTILPPRDLGPPALPILMVRATRQAVAENPFDAQSRMCLTDAIETRARQEDHWIGAFAPAKLRERMRQIQLVTNLYAVTQTQPDNFDSHRRLAEVFMREKMYDLALEHMQAAEKAMEAFKPANANDQKGMEGMLKQHRAEVEGLDKLVRMRVAKWKELSASMPVGGLSGGEVALQKAALAYLGEFEEVRGNQPVKAQLGLGKKALDILLEIKPESLPAKVRLADLQLRYQILLGMGRADIVMESLKNDDIRKSLPPDLYALNQLFAGAALGDYDAVDEGLAVLEKNFKAGSEGSRAGAAMAIGKYAPALLVTPQIGSASALAVAATLQANTPLRELNNLGMALGSQHNELSNAITLRGIMALEAGNTEHARTLFQRAIDEAGDTYYFTERPIARRYLDLLNEQKR
jgi:tetratricopeptide (TPR) repeat protein